MNNLGESEAIVEMFGVSEAKLWIESSANPAASRYTSRGGDLLKAQPSSPTVNEQAEHSVKVKSRGVKKFEIVKQDSLTINAEELPRGYVWGEKFVREVYLVHLQCEKTSRFFVIYSILTGNSPGYFASRMMLMANSFRCHQHMLIW